MSYTVFNGFPQGHPYCFTNKIREAMIAEIVAINGYAEHIENSNIEEINSVWKSIIKDEKEHYGMFLTLLRKYDLTEYQQYLKNRDSKPAAEAMQAYRPDYDRQLILNNVRSDIKGELEAVILYEQHWIEIPVQDVRDVYYEVIKVEKEHTEELTRVLLKYDKDKYDGLK